MTSIVFAAVEHYEWWQQLPHGALAKLVEQPLIGKHAVHVCEGCAVCGLVMIVPDSVT